MGLPGDLPEESLSETSSLSPEEVARCKAKNNELNQSLGLENDDSLDPAMLEEDDETVSDNKHGYSDLELTHIAEKMLSLILPWNISLMRRIQLCNKVKCPKVPTSTKMIQSLRHFTSPQACNLILMMRFQLLFPMT